MNGIINLPLIFTTAFIVALSGALAPGPLLAVTIHEATKKGFWVGPVLVLGHAIPEIIVVIALTRGISEFIKGALVTGIIGLMGGVILCIMGTTIIRKGRNAVMPMLNKGTAQPMSGRLVFSGVLASISNPYWFIWWATVGTTYVLWSSKMGALGISLFFTGHILGDFIWYAIVSLAIASGRRIMNDKVYRGLMVGSGSLVIVLGIYFAISGVRFFTG